MSLLYSLVKNLKCSKLNLCMSADSYSYGVLDNLTVVAVVVERCSGWHRDRDSAPLHPALHPLPKDGQERPAQG